MKEGTKGGNKEERREARKENLIISQAGCLGDLKDR